MLLMIASVFSLNIEVFAKQTNKTVILGGESIGLQVETGVFITGKYEINKDSGKIAPWKESNIEKGDIIIAINNRTIESISDVNEILNTSKENDVLQFVLSRNEKTIETEIIVTTDSNGKNSIGLYVKDKILGIGTITYIDKENNKYGALGHSISSTSYFPIFNGKILSSNVGSIRKSIPGTAGEKQAILGNQVFGDIQKNTEYGIFGSINNYDNFSNNIEIEVSSIREVRLGNAKIITVLDDNIKKEYDIEIISLKAQNNTAQKGIKFKVTDPLLLEKTGGIIQGMSGSPIIQNKRLVGAVSHVIVDNPETGYGIYIEWMLKNQ